MPSSTSSSKIEALIERMRPGRPLREDGTMQSVIEWANTSGQVVKSMASVAFQAAAIFEDEGKLLKSCSEQLTGLLADDSDD